MQITIDGGGFMGVDWAFIAALATVVGVVGAFWNLRLIGRQFAQAELHHREGLRASVRPHLIFGAEQALPTAPPNTSIIVLGTLGRWYATWSNIGTGPALHARTEIWFQNSNFSLNEGIAPSDAFLNSLGRANWEMGTSDVAAGSADRIRVKVAEPVAGIDYEQPIRLFWRCTFQDVYNEFLPSTTGVMAWDP